MNILCLDIGGTSTRGSIINNGKIMHKIVRKTPFSNKEEMLDQLVNIIKELDDNKTIDAISIGCAGPVLNYVMQGSKPMGILDNVNFKKVISEHTDKPLFVENDLQMAIRAEKKYGSGKGVKNFVVIALSTGIGVAVVKNNIILEGRIEIGHNIIQKSSWVSQTSGSAIKSFLDMNKKKISIQDFFNKPDKNFLDKIVEINTLGFTQIIHAYDPEKIIVMGSLGVNQFEKIVPSSHDIEKQCLLRPIPKIIKTKLGDEIGMLGAYELAYEKLI